MSITGYPNNPPTRAGVPISDMNASMMAVIGILSALMARNRTGRGQHVDISMLDSQISTLNYAAAIYFMSGEIPGRIGNAHINHVPYDVYPCSDGHIILAIASDEFWPNLLTVVDLPHLDTEENKQRPGRQKNRELIDSELEKIFRTHDRKHWMEKLHAARIPCAPVYDFNEAFNNPQVIARNMAIDVDYSNGQSVRVVGNPVKLSDTYADTYSPAPLLGQNNNEIFVNLLGRSEADMKALSKQGAI